RHLETLRRGPAGCCVFAVTEGAQRSCCFARGQSRRVHHFGTKSSQSAAPTPRGESRRFGIIRAADGYWCRVLVPGTGARVIAGTTIASRQRGLCDILAGSAVAFLFE